MEIVVAVVLVLVILGALMWRPPRGSRQTVSDALEADALRREQERNVTASVYNENRYNIPPRGRR